MSLQESHAKSHDVLHEPNRLANGRWARGQSGNPRGAKVFAARQAAARKHAAVLLKALLDELGSKLSAVDRAFADQACTMLSRATYSEKRRVYLTNQAHQIIDRLRERYGDRKRSLTLGEVLRRG
jgi:hypothetical protein